MKIRFIALLLLAFLPTTGRAVSPQMIADGEQLFKRNWESHAPTLDGDGLGPLYNASSCATCHQQGGIGGGGGAPFNAQSVGIDAIEIYGRPVDNTMLGNLISQFHPGFVQSDRSVITFMPLLHHGGSEAHQQFHDVMTHAAAADLSDAGGPSGPAEVRIANRSPILFDHTMDGFRIRISARLYGRNPPALFGSGLIDQISNAQLDRQVRLQKQHAEISGRPSTLEDGRYGKFGWRADVASVLEFSDAACANELGLQTQRMMQARDATNREYQNKLPDISDEQIQLLSHFVTALPAPRQELPSDSLGIASVHRGEKLFEEVGCTVCHVPDMLPAVRVFSDFLLHDMGGESIDLNHAEPYIVHRTLVKNEVKVDQPLAEQDPVSYDGLATSVPVISPNSNAPSSTRPMFSFRALQTPKSLLSFRLIDSKLNADTWNNTVANRNFMRNKQPTRTVVKTELRERMQIQSTNFNQEWRTAPLWGIRDSAPYWHDGRAETILEAIAMHDGEATGTRDRFLTLSYEDRQSVLDFLASLVAP